jgi:hypothetical protein
MPPRPYYATSLRCIAQDLERRGLKTFDIRFERDEYIAECGYQEPPAETPVTIHYTFQDIEDLDVSGEAKRGEPSGAKEFLNQIQIFRAIGGYLDKNKARLVRLTNNDGPRQDQNFKLEYITRDGERVIDDRPGSAVYDMCVVMYKQRGKMTGTGGRASRWRRS